MSHTPTRPGVAPATEGEVDKSMGLADIEQNTGNGGPSTDLARDSSMISPRFIPALDSPPLSIQLPPAPSTEENGTAPASFDRNCAPSQVSHIGYRNCAPSQAPCNQLRQACKQCDNHKKGTKAVLRPRLAATNAANKMHESGSSHDMDTSSSVPGKRY